MTSTDVTERPAAAPLDFGVLASILADVDAEIKTRQHTRFHHFKKWMTDPVGFVEDGLLGFVWSKQKEIMLSVRDNRRTAVQSCHDVGKALAAGESILTPDGWRIIGDLGVGDSVIAMDGTPTKVLGVYPQGVRALYRVAMSDGSSVFADTDHLWLTSTRAERRAGKPMQVRTTADIAASITFPNGSVRALNHEIPVCAPVQHPHRALPLDPYLLGQWLGDGVLNGRMSGQADQMECLQASGATVRRRVQSGNNESASVAGLVVGLRELGLLGVGSHERWIPLSYMHASIEQRAALLQGLMDTDGTVGRDNAALCFDTTSLKLADGVAELMRSLGGVVRRSDRIPEFNGVQHRRCYRLWPSLPPEVAPFRLARKTALYQRAWGDPNSDRRRRRFIESVTLAEAGEAVCIRVDHPSATFVTRDHIVTHNSYVAARIGAWWCSCHDPGDAFLVSVAPTFHQVKAILWREIQKAHAAGGLPGTLNLTEWKVGAELIGFGRSPADTDPTAIQGIHAPRVLVIGDEACGLAKAIIDGADSLIANDDSRILLIGNPDDPSTEFANVCKPGSGWNVIRIDAFESPNFTDEAVPDRIRPLLISRTWEAEKKKSWGEESPLYVAKVRGLFPEQANDALIPTASVVAAVNRFKEIEHLESPPLAPANEPHDLGVDVARMGDDASVIYRRKGWVFRCEHRHHKRDLMELVGEIVRVCRHDKPKRIKIDDTGMGGGVTDRLRQLQNSQDARDNEARVALAGVQICPINVGAGSLNTTADERFVNLRAELNWNMRVIFTEKPIAVEPSDDLESQIVQIKYTVPNGEIQIEKKADMKKRTKGKSPDDWDALVLAAAEPQMEGGGLFAYYAAQVAAAAAPAQISGPPTASNGGVVLVSPLEPNGQPTFSTVYGMSGKMYSVTGGQIVVVPDDVATLLQQGFKPAASA